MKFIFEYVRIFFSYYYTIVIIIDFLEKENFLKMIISTAAINK